VSAQGWFIIVFLTLISGRIEQILTDQNEKGTGYVTQEYIPVVSQLIVPAVVSLINAIIPTVVWIIVKLSKWDSVGTEIKQQVRRNVTWLARVRLSYAPFLYRRLVTCTPIIYKCPSLSI
jgi:hypothetical protein